MYRTRVVLAFLFLFAVGVLVPGYSYAADPYEPNNSMSSAAIVTYPTDIQAEFSHAWDTDYYKIHLESGCYRFTASQEDSPYQLYNLTPVILDSAGVLVSCGPSVYREGSTETRYTVTQAGDYYVQIGEYDEPAPVEDPGTPYRLVIDAAPDTFEPNNTRANATSLAQAGVYTSYTSTPNDIDYYKMYLSEGAIVHVFTEHLGGMGMGGLKLQVFGGVDTVPSYEEHCDAPNEAVGTVIRADVEGYVYVSVQPWPINETEGWESPYTLTVTGDFSVLPKAVVYNPIAPSTMYRSHPYTIYGYVVPKHTSGYYLVQLNFYLRNSHGVYVYHHSVNARRYYYSTTKTKYKATVSLPHKGRWRVRAYHSDAGHAPSYSGYDYITVK